MIRAKVIAPPLLLVLPVQKLREIVILFSRAVPRRETIRL
jgi:hypothetical protein